MTPTTVEELATQEALQTLPEQADGWHTPVGRPSLSEVYATIRVPLGGPWWRRLLAFVGPGYLVAVGYMDPGNWATDIAGGSAYNYKLLSAVLISSVMAMFLQALSAKLGIATGRDLAQACRDAYSKPVSLALWISAEIAIVACDIAEVVGAAIALNLLFGLPLLYGVILTAADVLMVLALQNRGFRIIEAFVITLIATMMVIFGIEIFYAHPNWGAMGGGLIPTAEMVRNRDMLFIALGILGATVMPHNLYLHSSIVQTRDFGKSPEQLKEAVRHSYIDSTVALTLAFFVNAAILVLAAAVFYKSGRHDVQEIQTAYKLISPLLGVSVAAPLFAIALLASGQNSTLTGTLAGQVIMEGFLRIKIQPWVRRMISRCLAIVPAVIAIGFYGDSGLARLILISQVVLAIQLSFAVFPLMQFTSDKRKMREFVNGPVTRWIGWFMAVAIAVLSAFGVWQTDWHTVLGG